MGKVDTLIQEAQRTVRSYYSSAQKHYFASLLLIVVLLLTHFTLGPEATICGLSYADVVCLTGIGVAGALLIFRRFLARKKIRNIALLVSTVAAALLYLAAQIPMDAVLAPFVFAASALATGVFIVFSGTLWFDYFADESIEVVALSLSVCLTGACLLTWFLLGMMHDRFVVGYVMMIFLASTLQAIAFRSKEARARDDFTLTKGSDGTVRRSTTTLLVCLFVLAFASMISSTFAGNRSWHDDEVWIIVMPVVLLICIVALFGKMIESGGLLSLALILAVLSVLLSSLFSINPSVLFVIASSEMAITVSLAIIFVHELAKRTPCVPFEMGAWFVLVLFPGCILGKYAAVFALTADDGGLAKTILTIAVVVVLVVCVTFCLGSKSLNDIMRRRFRNVGVDREGITSRLRTFADERRLGAREFEVLCLLLEGCTAKEVAERMYVANGTAKAHIRHVYQKMEVSDRGSLLSVVQSRVPDYDFKKDTNN